MSNSKEMSTDTLRQWLDTDKPVTILDIRTPTERAEWSIPGSVHLNAYDKLKAKNPNALRGLHLDKDTPVVTVCAAGKTSLIAADMLQQQGYDSYSLLGGMKNWSLSWNTASIVYPDFEIMQFRRTGKGCLSYMIIANHEAMVVDASIEIAVYLNIIEERKLKLRFVTDTHVHADHLSRSKELAEKGNSPLYMPIPNTLTFRFQPVTADTTFNVGNILVSTIQTPGHTIESVSYLVHHKVLLTGDTLFTNGVGRPDLKADQVQTIEKSKMLYHSLRNILTLDDTIMIMPAHINQPVEFDGEPIQATLSAVKEKVKMLELSEEDFAQTLLQRIPPTPSNYLAITIINTQGNTEIENALDLEAGANRCAIL